MRAGDSSTNIKAVKVVARKGAQVINRDEDE